MHIVVTRLALGLAGTALLAGALAAAGPAVADTVPQRPAEAAAATGGGFSALTPARLLDTRPSSALARNGARTLQVTGRGGVPASGVAAVVLNLTVVAPQSQGYLTAYPGTSRPTVSNVNFVAGQTVANLAVVPVAPDGTVTLFNGSAGSTNVLADVTGWFSPVKDGSTPSTDGAFKAAGPGRLLDTRQSTPIAAGGTREVQVTGRLGVPTLAGAAVLNVTAVTTAAAGYATVYPGGTRPTSSNLNFAVGQTVAGLSASPLSDDGTVTIYNGSARPLQVAVDLAGWFVGTTAQQAGNFSFLTPARVFDTRSPKSTLTSGQTRTFTVGGRGGVPTSGVAAVVLTVTVTNTAGAGYLTVYPGGTRPTASTLNFTRGQTVPNLVIVPVTNGTITLYNGSSGSADVLADVAGFVRGTTLTPPAPSVSHYIRYSVSPTMTNAQITAAAGAIGQNDADAASATDRQIVLLQFGAQSVKAGPAGNQKGVRLTTNEEIRLTYPQVVATVNGYVDGYVEGRGTATNPVTVLVGTNTDGFAGADTSYPPTTKGQDWANLVVEPAVTHAAGTGITVTGASDIEPDFDANVTQITTWINAYLGAGPNPLVNNGAASGCPTTLGQLSKTCSPIRILNDQSRTNTWTQRNHYDFSGGLNPTRISVLPQIYFPYLGAQWENISLTGVAAGRPALTLAGVLTSVSACDEGGGCDSIDPDDAWTSMTQALQGNAATAGRTVPAVSDIAID